MIEQINNLFSESVFLKYRTQRYGLKNCSKNIDSDYLFDIKNLYERTKEMDDCGFSLSPGCSITKIEELISTL